jgi:hypothetical protein
MASTLGGLLNVRPKPGPMGHGRFVREARRPSGERMVDRWRQFSPPSSRLYTSRPSVPGNMPCGLCGGNFGNPIIRPSGRFMRCRTSWVVSRTGPHRRGTAQLFRCHSQPALTDTRRRPPARPQAPDQRHQHPRARRLCARPVLQGAPRRTGERALIGPQVRLIQIDDELGHRHRAGHSAVVQLQTCILLLVL